jgi:hypothetical protein
MKKPCIKKLEQGNPNLFGRSMSLLVCVALSLASNTGLGGDAPPTKQQVEAVFLLKFAKYVDWPASTFASASAPIIIGVMGTDPFGDSLQHAEGKPSQGRPFVIKHLAADSDPRGCQILFISESESPRMREILEKAGALPILTVGEGAPFAQNGGIINFVLKNGNVRLEIDLAAARKAGLAISSRLLAVADVVKGKPN